MPNLHEISYIIAVLWRKRHGRAAMIAAAVAAWLSLGNLAAAHERSSEPEIVLRKLAFAAVEAGMCGVYKNKVGDLGCDPIARQSGQDARERNEPEREISNGIIGRLLPKPVLITLLIGLSFGGLVVGCVLLWDRRS